MSSTDRGYESLVRDFYQALVQDDGFDTISVQHDMRIQGKSGESHQIDVFWEFKMAGVTFRTAIECRQYNSRIKKSHVAAFQSVISDIGCTGMIVTTVGFQSGAVSYAEHHQIHLALLNPMLREIHMILQPILTDVTNWRFIFDQAHCDRMKANLGIESIPIEIVGPVDEIHFTDEAGNPTTTLAEIIRPHRLELGEHELKVNAYVPTRYGPVLLRAVGFKVISRSLPPSETVVINLSAVRAVLEDLKSTPPKYLRPDGTISNSVNGEEDGTLHQSPLAKSDGRER